MLLSGAIQGRPGYLSGGHGFCASSSSFNVWRRTMANSTLIPTGEEAPEVNKGHGTGALGPSDSSDSGSDVHGAKRHEFDVDSPLDNHALELGEDELGSDSDRHGTGDRAAADGDSTTVSNDDLLPDESEGLAAEDFDESLTDEGEGEGEDPNPGGQRP
jgi:hypothetical protein